MRSGGFAARCCARSSRRRRLRFPRRRDVASSSCVARTRVVTSLDAVSAGGDLLVSELIADPAVPDMTSALERELACDALRGAVAVLPPRTARVIELRYGLEGGEPLSHKEIGRALGFSVPSDSRQLEREGLRRLRALAARAALDG